ncbi:hypothetical protein ASF58_07555 [Methylobacterium sp. Leaf125]|nr:hypothetical protein ASF58_07555 [Methylobacterium sp. Leaf125]
MRIGTFADSASVTPRRPTSARNAPARPALISAVDQKIRRVTFDQQDPCIEHVLAAETDVPEFAIRHRR